MKALNSFFLSFFIVLSCLAGLNAEPASTSINPALLYYQAFLVAPAPLPQAEWDYLASKEGHTQPLPDRYGAIVAGYDNQFALVRQAAQSTVPCDWGSDLSSGPETLLPYLAPAKAVMVAARLRLTWGLQHDRQADAREDLLASLALARNVSRNGTVIGLLVEIATESIACSTVAENFGQFTPETLQRLAEGLDALPARGTVAGCIPAERVLSKDWTLRRIQELQRANPGDDAKVMEGIHDVLAGKLNLRTRAGLASDDQSEQAQWWERLTQAAGSTSEGVVKLIRDLAPFEQQLAGILMLPFEEIGAR